MAATMTQLQFMLKQLGLALEAGTPHEVATADLDKLTLTIFRHVMTSEEACYIGGVARGVGNAVAGKVSRSHSCTSNLMVVAVLQQWTEVHHRSSP